LARDKGLNVVERDVLVEEVLGANEAWCTGTAAVITPIGVVNLDNREHTIGNGEVGQYTQIFYDQLNAIQTKKAEDKYGWVVTIGKK
jgi:branched-chain amino acid aminotransferase